MVISFRFLGRKFVNSSLYDYSLAVAYLFIALLYPVLTSIADTRGNKKVFHEILLLYGLSRDAPYFIFSTVLIYGLVFFA